MNATAATARETGTLERAAGPVVVARGLPHARLYDVVRVGPLRLPGEIIRIDGDDVVIQVYEETAGLVVGDPVESTGEPLQVELGPGLLGTIFDGTQRPLATLAGGEPGAPAQPFMPRGADAAPLSRERIWVFVPLVEEGDEVGPGDLLGTVRETAAIEHRVLCPHGIHGAVEGVRAGETTIDDPVMHVGGAPVALLRRWSVRRARPAARRLDPTRPLVTGQRVIDVLFPLALGGTAAIPGGFGTGKTVLEQSLAKHAEIDVVVYVACGERGNELAEVLQEFPHLRDPRSGASLMERTILIANTSNMPVAAREASIYTGVTLAEYYRDQGYHVALMADSTSRWGEALREVSSRLGEMPAEEGYPASLASRLAALYERAGAVVCLGAEARQGSLTVIGAVSPPGGDLSEPVTQNTLRVTGTFWSLDTELARQRHFPSVSWMRSYTLYDLDRWFAAEVDPEWPELRRWASTTLAREGELLDIVQVLGSDALAPPERVVLRTGRLLREDLLQQSSFDPDDASCPLTKQLAMLRVTHAAHLAMVRGVEAGASPEAAGATDEIIALGRMKDWPAAEATANADMLIKRLATEVTA